MPCLNHSQTLKMISQVESFPYPDKQGTPEEGKSSRSVLQLITIKMRTTVQKITHKILLITFCNDLIILKNSKLSTYLEKIGTLPFSFLPKTYTGCCCYIIGSIWKNPRNWDKIPSFFSLTALGTKGKSHHTCAW